MPLILALIGAGIVALYAAYRSANPATEEVTYADYVPDFAMPDFSLPDFTIPESVTAAYEDITSSASSAYNDSIMAIQNVGFSSMVDPDKNLIAFKAMINKAEGSPRYDQAFGYQTFSSYEDHPRIGQTVTINGKRVRTDAAGRYQELSSTFDYLAKKLGTKGFTPEVQELHCDQLLRENGAMPYIRKGDFDTAIKKASPTWASLPYSTANQNKRSYEYVAQAFTEAGGQIAVRTIST